MPSCATTNDVPSCSTRTSDPGVITVISFSRRLVDHPHVAVSIGELHERMVQRSEFGRQRAGGGKRAREQPDPQRHDGRGGIAEHHRAEFRSRARGVRLAVLGSGPNELLFDLLLFRLRNVGRLRLRILAGSGAGGHQQKQQREDVAHHGLLIFACCVGRSVWSNGTARMLAFLTDAIEAQGAPPVRGGGYSTAKRTGGRCLPEMLLPPDRSASVRSRSPSDGTSSLRRAATIRTTRSGRKVAGACSTCLESKASNPFRSWWHLSDRPATRGTREP